MLAISVKIKVLICLRHIISHIRTLEFNSVVCILDLKCQIYKHVYTLNKFCTNIIDSYCSKADSFFEKHKSDQSLRIFTGLGNYYGTPRPVHINPDSPPITYQEHRNLLRKFRTRSKSLSNLEKAGEEGDNSEEDSGLSGRKSSDQIWFVCYRTDGCND